MKKILRDNDPFDIKKTENRYSKQRHNEVIKANKDYSKGEQSPYRDWKTSNGGYDPIELDRLTDIDAPWQSIALSDTVEEQWRALNLIYPTLKGRQKQVVDLLLKGNTNQSLIAIQLGIDRRALYKIFQVLIKKISKKMTL